MLRACLALVLVVASAGPAGAQDSRAEARRHFERGVELFDEGRLVSALAEFEEAYRISPAAAVLYNIAQLHAELGQSVEAVETYERFLAEATDLDPELRAEVDDAVARERARIGALLVTVSVPGAHVSVDDVEVGLAPLASTIPVSSGEHVVSAQADGYETVRHRFRVAGGQTVDVSLSLVASGALGASIRVTSRVPGIEIRVDGTSRGLTPLDSTVALSPGPHVVEGLRDGYTRFAQNIDVAGGAETTVAVVVERDTSAPASVLSTLEIDLPSAAAAVRIDGETVLADGRGIEVVVGLHDVEIQVADREIFRDRIDVEPGVPYTLSPGWEWTPDAREARLAASRGQAELGLGLLGGGVAALVLGVGVIIGARVWFETELGPFRQAVAACYEWAGGAVPSLREPCIDGLERFSPPVQLGMLEIQANRFATSNLQLADDNLTAYYALLTGGIVLGAVGALGIIVGGVLIGEAPDERDIDRAARAELPRLRFDLGPAGASLSGTF